MAECKADLIKFIDENDEITFIDSDVTRVDTLGVQLLLSVVFYIAAQNKMLHWTIQSAVVVQSITQLGVNEEILNKHINN